MIAGQKCNPPSIEHGADVPATCGVCARRSHAIAYFPDRYGQKLWMWICDDCVQPAKVIYMAKPKELEKYENQAICASTEKTKDDLFTALFKAAYDEGADRIADISPDMMDKIILRAMATGDLIVAQQKFLIEYSEAMRDIVKNEIPF